MVKVIFPKMLKIILPLSRGFRAEVPEEGVLRPEAAGDRTDPPEALRMEGDHDTRGRGLPRPRAHADFDPAQILGFRDNGIPQGQIVPDDLPEVGEREIQVPEPRILVPWVLRRHGWEKR